MDMGDRTVNLRAKGLEPSPEAWKAAVLPIHHARVCFVSWFQGESKGQGFLKQRIQG